MKTYISITFLLSFLSFSPQASVSEEKIIQALLKRVENSKAIFIRNGSEHTSVEARKHLEFKMNQARSMFWFFGPKSKMSAIDFIKKIATKSSSSGKPYQVRLPSGETMFTGDWLKNELKIVLQKISSSK